MRNVDLNKNCDHLLELIRYCRRSLISRPLPSRIKKIDFNISTVEGDMLCELITNRIVRRRNVVCILYTHCTNSVRTSYCARMINLIKEHARTKHASAHTHTHTHDIKLVYTFSNHPLDRQPLVMPFCPFGAKRHWTGKNFQRINKDLFTSLSSFQSPLAFS